jgi:hypothetical protein
MIILVNLIPLFGVLFMRWSQGELLLLYWSESAAIGFYNIFKLLLARLNLQSTSKDLSKYMRSVTWLFMKLFLVAFFIVHFGGFMLVHLSFIQALLDIEGSVPYSYYDPFTMDLPMILAPIWFGTLAFFLSHGVSFVQNYILKKEYTRAHVGVLMFLPYPRIVLMHLAILFGFLFIVIVQLFGLPPIGPMLILIAGKTLFDVGGHLREHAQL